MYILGLSFDFHDSAAALIKDGKIIAAAQEERFSRIKNDSSFPKKAIQFCLDYENITSQQIDFVTYYEKPLLKFERIIRNSLKNYPKSKSYFVSTLNEWILKNKFTPNIQIANHLNIPINRIHYIKHHDSHAASAFYCSPFLKSTIITIDGVGEFETVTVSIGNNYSITKLNSINLPHSVGLFYSALTAYLGFEINEGEYKVMGMSAYGTPKYFDFFYKMFELSPNGGLRIKDRFFNFLTPDDIPFTYDLIEVFGPPRDPHLHFNISARSQSDNLAQNQKYADIAASTQKCTEEIVLHIVEKSIKKTGIKNVCLAGGVALNSLANGRIIRELNCKLYVIPSPGDSGGAIGSALFFYHNILKYETRYILNNPFLGKDFSEKEIEETILQFYDSHDYSHYEKESILIDDVVQHINRGKIIGWFQGRAELGPRALGNRSILANPTLKQMKDIVNEKIKFREPFRPFAPSVIDEKARDYFEISCIDSETNPEYFMLAICDVKKDKREIIPAVTHIDGTARVQLVTRKTNPRYYNLIAAFEKYSGVPILLNTSFNLKGEPIVNSPKDAIETFEYCNMDYLVLGNYLIKKRGLS